MESTVVIVNRETDLDAVRAARLPTAEMLSLSVRGIDMGSPWATISHVEVGTVESACFIFDVADLQLVETPSPAALALLKAFLETSGIAKVVHDSRAPSDVLYRQCNILLRNVHDTQVWWSVLSSGDELHLASFNDTLISYGCAPVPPRDESALAETPAFWATRPITDEMQGWAVQVRARLSARALRVGALRADGNRAIVRAPSPAAWHMPHGRKWRRSSGCRPRRTGWRRRRRRGAATRRAASISRASATPIQTLCTCTPRSWARSLAAAERTSARSSTRPAPSL